MADVAEHSDGAVVVTRRVRVLAQHAAVPLAPLQIGDASQFAAFQICPGETEAGQTTITSTALQVCPGEAS